MGCGCQPVEKIAVVSIASIEKVELLVSAVQEARTKQGIPVGILKECACLIRAQTEGLIAHARHGSKE